MSCKWRDCYRAIAVSAGLGLVVYGELDGAFDDLEVFNLGFVPVEAGRPRGVRGEGYGDNGGGWGRERVGYVTVAGEGRLGSGIFAGHGWRYGSLLGGRIGRGIRLPS